MLSDATEELESNGIRLSIALMVHNILLKVGRVHGVLDVSGLSLSPTHKYMQHISYIISSVVNCFFPATPVFILPDTKSDKFYLMSDVRLVHPHS